MKLKTTVILLVRLFVLRPASNREDPLEASHMWGIFGASLIRFFVTLFCIAAYYTIGPTLLSASSYLNYFQSASWKLPSLAFFALYATVAANNLPAAVLICLAFVFGCIFGYITVTDWSFILFSRAVFALAFDRFLPTQFADVNEKFHTPVKAYILYAVCRSQSSTISRSIRNIEPGAASLH